MTELELLFAHRPSTEIVHIRVIRDDWDSPERTFATTADLAVKKLRWYASRNATIEVCFRVAGRWQRLAGPRFRPDRSGLKVVSDTPLTTAGVA